MKKFIIMFSVIFVFVSPLVHAQTVDDMNKTVVFLRQQTPQTVMIDGRTAEIFYRHLGTEAYKPIMETASGTGFIINPTTSFTI